MARLMKIPVVMVVSARNAGYSTAAMLYGFKHFNTELKIAGVIFNQVTSAAQYGFLRETCAEAGVECLGYLPYLEETGLPPRHQALTLPARKSLDQLLNQVAEQLAQHVDIDKLLNLSTRIFPCTYSLPYISRQKRIYGPTSVNSESPWLLTQLFLCISPEHRQDKGRHHTF